MTHNQSALTTLIAEVLADVNRDLAGTRSLSGMAGEGAATQDACLAAPLQTLSESDLIVDGRYGRALNPHARPGRTTPWSASLHHSCQPRTRLSSVDSRERCAHQVHS